MSAAPQTPPTPFEAGIELFNTPRIDGEIDLVPEIRKMFTNEGVEEEVLTQCYDGNRHIKGAVGKNSVAQRTQINRYLELALINSEEPTMRLRSELLPNGSVANWMKLVESKVVPFIAERKLLG